MGLRVLHQPDTAGGCGPVSPGGIVRLREQPVRKLDREKDVKKILVVDDEESIRLLYQEELEEQGYTVILAGNADEALEQFSAAQPDLVILDIKMPGRSGIEVLQIIREQSRNVPVILSTAYGEYKQDLQTWASDAYIVKSANVDKLINKVREILSRE
jgi:two-component system, response regulator, stage 0 sporulation protein F